MTKDSTRHNQQGELEQEEPANTFRAIADDVEAIAEYTDEDVTEQKLRAIIYAVRESAERYEEKG